MEDQKLNEQDNRIPESLDYSLEFHGQYLLQCDEEKFTKAFENMRLAMDLIEERYRMSRLGDEMTIWNQPEIAKRFYNSAWLCECAAEIAADFDGVPEKKPEPEFMRYRYPIAEIGVDPSDVDEFAQAAFDYICQLHRLDPSSIRPTALDVNTETGYFKLTVFPIQ